MAVLPPIVAANTVLPCPLFLFPKHPQACGLPLLCARGCWRWRRQVSVLVLDVIRRGDHSPAMDTAQGLTALLDSTPVALRMHSYVSAGIAVQQRHAHDVWWDAFALRARTRRCCPAGALCRASLLRLIRPRAAERGGGRRLFKYRIPAAPHLRRTFFSCAATISRLPAWALAPSAFLLLPRASVLTHPPPLSCARVRTFSFSTPLPACCARAACTPLPLSPFVSLLLPISTACALPQGGLRAANVSRFGCHYFLFSLRRLALLAAVSLRFCSPLRRTDVRWKEGGIAGARWWHLLPALRLCLPAATCTLDRAENAFSWAA